MIESNNPEINVDELMARIREEVARRRADHATPPPAISRAENPTPISVDWSRMDKSLQIVDYHAQHIGDTTSEWMHFGRLKRKIARQVGRLILYLSKFIINKQKQFNMAALQSLRTIVDCLRSLEADIREQDRKKNQELQEQRTALQQREMDLEQRKGREKELERTLYQLKMNLVQQERRVTLLLEEARKRLPEPFDQSQLQTLVDEDQHRLDALYVSFEDQFRGTREDIKERLRIYLPLLKEKSIGTEQMPILDIGCGRGEWLELMREEGLLAQGVDINRVLVEQCRERGFKITENDILTYLRSLPDRSTGAVTGFHIVERLSLDSLIKLFDETVRVLAPGGVAIFETPNPQNIMVGSCNFYLDPTHKNALPSPTLKFIAEARGLCRVEVWDLHPYPAAFRIDGSELAKRFSEFFYGPQEYAVVGWKV